MQGIISVVVRQKMRARRWTQQELAHRSGVDAKQISRLLSNRTDWWLRDMRLVSKAFDLPIEALILEEVAA